MHVSELENSFEVTALKNSLFVSTIERPVKMEILITWKILTYHPLLIVKADTFLLQKTTFSSYIWHETNSFDIKKAYLQI